MRHPIYQIVPHNLAEGATKSGTLGAASCGTQKSQLYRFLAPRCRIGSPDSIKPSSHPPDWVWVGGMQLDLSWFLLYCSQPVPSTGSCTSRICLQRAALAEHAFSIRQLHLWSMTWSIFFLISLFFLHFNFGLDFPSLLSQQGWRSIEGRGVVCVLVRTKPLVFKTTWRV